MKNLFGEYTPYTETEILSGIEQLSPVVLVAFSGGNDSRVLAHVAKAWAESSGIDLRLAAIRTGLQMDGWQRSVEDYADWICLPLEIYTGDGFASYQKYVEEYGFPGNAKHSQVQNRLKGRAFRKMKKAHGSGLVILSGIRKAESERRARLVSPYSEREGVRFVSPLFNWSDAKLYDYMDHHDIPAAAGKQWDCKCGATAKEADAEWAEIEAKAPKLHAQLCGLNNPSPWDWGKFDRHAHAIGRQLDAGQQWLDDGSLESFPVCVNCWRDKAAQDGAALEEWE
ncbi:MAG: phosphoadenosine phosphosulfate reductase family protein [Rhizobiaceae bacterium]